jgi:hypothetical protein
MRCTVMAVTRRDQRPKMPSRLRQFAIDMARDRCLGCGGTSDLRVAHRSNQNDTRAEVTEKVVRCRVVGSAICCVGTPPSTLKA